MMNRLYNLFSSRYTATSQDKLTNHTHENFSVVIPQSTGILKFSSSSDNEEKQVINNAIIEALAIHIRSLLDFFYLDMKRWDDDVIAVHFFIDKNDWINERPSKTKEEIKIIKDRVNKEIAHLTYFRQGVTDKSWLFQEMVDDINNVVSKFCEIVPSELLGDRWKDDSTA
ncbi:MAG: hypothetical protein WBB64_10140 [Anaerolineales bacterium]